MKKSTKFLATLMATASLLTAFGATGCGKQLGDLAYDFSETEEKISYTFFSTNWQDFEGKEKDRVLKHLEDKFNVSIKITGAGGDKWQDRLSTKIADNETPDLFFALPDTSTITDYIKKQVITDINPYIEKANAKNLEQILGTEQYKKSTLIDGKNYFVPQSVGYTTRIILVRKDWMKQWNEDTIENGGRALTGDAVYSEPTTLSDFTSMLTYFRNGDPDGNGKKDTYGLSLSKNFDYVQDFFATFGLKPEYCLDDKGNYQLSAMTEEYKDMLDWFKAGNTSGYIRPEFFTYSETEALQSFYQGQCGAVVSSGDLLLDGIINEVINASGNKSSNLYGKTYQELLTLVSPPDSDDGKNKGAFRGWNFYWGGWCVSATAKEPMRLIKILDYLFSPEGQKMMVYGLEGTHYTEENGVIIPNNAERLSEGANVFSRPDANKVNEPAGRYMIGYQLTPCPYLIEDNKLVINYPYDTAFDPVMMKEAYDLTVKNTPNITALASIIADPDMNDYNSIIHDAIKTYTLNVISGNDTQADAYESLMGRLNSAKYKEVLKYINKNNK